MTRRPSPALLLAGALLALLAACGDRAGQQGESAAAPATPATDPSASPELADLLAKADAADGSVDHVVGKCVLCGLGMPGKEANAVTLGDYRVYLCSPSEIPKLQADPAGRLKAALGG